MEMHGLTRQTNITRSGLRRKKETMQFVLKINFLHNFHMHEGFSFTNAIHLGKFFR